MNILQMNNTCPNCKKVKRITNEQSKSNVSNSIHSKPKTKTNHKKTKEKNVKQKATLIKVIRLIWTIANQFLNTLIKRDFFL